MMVDSTPSKVISPLEKWRAKEDDPFRGFRFGPDFQGFCWRNSTKFWLQENRGGKGVRFIVVFHQKLYTNRNTLRWNLKILPGKGETSTNCGFFGFRVSSRGVVIGGKHQSNEISIPKIHSSHRRNRETQKETPLNQPPAFQVRSFSVSGRVSIPKFSLCLCFLVRM